MRKAVRGLIDRVEADSGEQREEAILQLAMLLEKCSSFHDEKSFYQSVLEPELLQIQLNESEKEELVDDLSALAKRSQPDTSLVWAISKADGPICLSRLIGLLDRHQPVLSQEATWQALTGINRWLSGRKDDPLLQQMLSPANVTALATILNDLNGRDTRIRVLAQRIKGKLSTHLIEP